MKNLKQILCVLLIFLLGAAGGGLVMHMVYKSHMESFLRGDRKAREEILLDRLSRKLDLDNLQREQVRKIIDQTHAEMNNIRKQYRPQMEAVLEKSRAEMRQILRPGQREKFEQFLEKRKARHKGNQRN
jgi:Spy/CpxP family protein refolding chaperone